jgi:lysophospholipase L1-like esterase
MSMPGTSHLWLALPLTAALIGCGGGSAGRGGIAGQGGGGGAGGASGYRPCPSNGDACAILPIGDSITDGYNVPGGYRIELFRSAHAAGHNITFTGSLTNGPATVDGVAFPIRHEGHSGWRIDMIAGQVPAPALGITPHIVLLMAGTNDVIQNSALAQAPGRLGTLIDALAIGAPDALIVVAQLTPLGDPTEETNVVAYNDALPAIVAARVDAGNHVVLVDMHTGFPGSELADMIHPTTDGYARMAGVWYATLAPLLP